MTTTVAAVIAASALVAGTQTAATADDTDHAGDNDGVERRGGAYMGWKNTDPKLRKPSRTPSAPAAASVPGIDVSGHQNAVDWDYWVGQGKEFAYVKATEGDYYRNEDFAQQYNGSYDAGMLRGAYHFAIPNGASATTQADYFVDHGGGWSSDGQTLPGVLDIEFNPYDGGTCYGLSDAQMVNWIQVFLDRYRERTGRDAVIYTNANWWRECTGNSTAFSSTNPLWIASYTSEPPTMPGGWSYHTFWQYTDTPLDQDLFNGSYDRLVALATG